MLPRSRRTTLTWAVVCFALLALLWAVAVWHPSVLMETIDAVGEDAAGATDDSAALWHFFRGVEYLFGPLGVTIMTSVLFLVLVRRHRRAAVFVAVTVAVASGLRYGLLALVARARPEWQLELGFHSTNSFPSGHATSATVLCGVAAVVVAMLIRRRGLRRLLYVGLALIVIVVCLDRVFLGRHYVTDTIAGVLYGAGMVMLALSLYNPQPRSHAEKASPLVESAPRSGRRLAVIVNPVKVESVGQFRYVVAEMAGAAGWNEPEWLYTTVDDPGTGMALAAQESGADLVIVCGGDGTVREVCAALAGTGIPVGIIPAGTGNLLARNLEIPLYLRAAIDIALTGQDRAIDLVEVSGDDLDDTHFMVMAGMGFDAAIMDGVNDDIKEKIGWLAYVISGARSLMFPAVRIEVSVDDGPVTKHRARTVVVGNVGYLQAGMPLLPDAAIDDGQIDAVILYPRRFFSWLPLAFRILRKGRRTDALVNRVTGRSIVVRASQDTPRQLDGDPIGRGRELRATCVPGTLLVRVPRPAASRLTR